MLTGFENVGPTGPAFSLSLATMNTKKNTELFAVRRLEVSQIGPFAQLDMTFPDKPIQDKAEIHILTGENGTGKSTVLQIFSSSLTPRKGGIIEKKMWSDGATNYTTTYSDGIPNFYDRRLIRYEPPELATIRRDFGDYPDLNFSPYIRNYSAKTANDRYSVAFFAYSGYRKLSDSTVETISDSKGNPLKNALDFDKSIDTKTFVNWLASTITRSALAMAKGRSEDRVRAKNYGLPVKQLEGVISNITGQRIKFELQENPLAILIHVDGQPLEFEQLPDGLKSIVSWLGDLIMRLDRIQWEQQVSLTERNFILFLDEIEIHLHPAWQRKILPVIQQLFPNAQIFISTHSPFVVGSVDGAWVHRFVKNEQGHSRLEGDPILSEDSNSYEYILSEIFGIKERFGIEVERDLQEFKTVKNQILHNSPDYNSARFEQLIEKLMSQSTEVQSIIGMELRQLSRLTNRTFA